MAFQAIFFDLDDTLHDHQKPFVEALQSVFPIKSQNLPMNDVYKTFRYYSDSMWENHINGTYTLVEFRIERAVRTLRDYEVAITASEALQFQLQYEEALHSIALLPEVPSLLTSLTEHGFIVGVITNGPAEHQTKKIESLGLTKYVPKERIFISGAMGVEKPNPEIFQEVAKKIGVKPEALLYIGDSWINDIVGSHRAGWQSVWFNHRKRQPESDIQPLREIDHLSDLLDVLKLSSIHVK